MQGQVSAFAMIGAILARARERHVEDIAEWAVAADVSIALTMI